MNLVFEIGQVIRYYPDELAADVQNSIGIIYQKVPFVTSSSIVIGPLEPYIKESPLEDTPPEKAPTKGRLINTGSFVLLGRFPNIDKVAIISVLNDDLTILGSTGLNVNLSRNFPLLSLVESGDILFTALGKYKEDPFVDINDTPNRFKREYGSWLLLKHFGDAILSNTNSSAIVWLLHDGSLKLYGTTYEILGKTSSLYETENGDCLLSRGNSIQSEDCYVKLSKDNELILKFPNGTIVGKEGELSVNTTDLNLNSTNVNVQAVEEYKNIEESNTYYTNYSVTANNIDISANYYTKVIDNIAENISKDSYSLILTKSKDTSELIYSIEIGDKVKLSGTTSEYSIEVDKTSLSLDESNATLNTDKINIKAKEVTIDVDGNKLVIDKSGVKIKPTTMVEVGDNPTHFVVVAPTAGSGPALWGQLMITPKIKVSLT